MSVLQPTAFSDDSHAASELLERAGELSALRECVENVRRSSRGRIVLVSGEAGAV